MGGSDAHLLVGIKNTNLDPVWIKTLSSGVAVYRSVFRDIWGSNLIFAGPHKTFSNISRICAINHTELDVMAASGSGTVEQFIEVGGVGDMLHQNDRPLGSKMVAATMIRSGESDCI